MDSRPICLRISVQALDQVGVDVDVEFLPLFQQELLIDQVTENVALAVGVELVRIFGLLLPDFGLQLVLTVDVLGPSDDLIVNADMISSITESARSAGGNRARLEETAAAANAKR